MLYNLDELKNISCLSKIERFKLDVVRDAQIIAEAISVIVSNSKITTENRMSNHITGIQIKDSDIVIAIFDITREFNEEDEEILKLVKEKNAIIVLNKIDLNTEKNIEKIKEISKPIIKISTKTKEGIKNLYNEISKIYKLKEIANNGELIVSNNRHKKLIKNAKNNLLEARQTIANNLPIDIISGNLKEILEELGKITGETVTEDVIKEIFSKFCLGK